MQNMETTRNRFSIRRQNMTEEQCANERQLNRDRQRICLENMTKEQSSMVPERDRLRHRAPKENPTLPSTSTTNNDARLFEIVIQQHVQAEVERTIGPVLTISMNISEGYMELGPQHIGKLYMEFVSMLVCFVSVS
ncbi:hypothetical protein MKX01_026629 [Papaver californicum]|nr:hypothetical protein MKX01_026629 [Papaver californicum]